MPDATAGSELVEAFAPAAPQKVKDIAIERVDAYLAKSYDKLNLGRSAPPGVLYKSGAAGILHLFRSQSVAVVGDDDE